MKKEKHISESEKYFRVMIRMPDGGRFTKNVNKDDYPTRAQALTAAKMIRDKALSDRAAGRGISVSPTVAEIYEKLPDIFGHSKKTIRRHDILYRAGICYLSAKKITAIKTADIMENVSEYAQNHTDGAVSQYISLWSVIFEAAQMMDIPVPNRAKVVSRNRPKAKQPTHKREVMASDHDIAIFLDALSSYGTQTEKGRYKARVMTMLAQIMIHTGCRPSEALALRRSDVNLISGDISITKSVGSTRNEAGRVIRATKTGQSVRQVPIDHELLDMLIDFLRWQHHDFILSDYDGNLMEIDYVSNHMRLVSKKAKVHVTLYMFRHKFSTDMIKVADMRTVQDLMGHESSSMTLAYARSSEADRKAAIDRRKLS